MLKIYVFKHKTIFYYIIIGLLAATKYHFYIPLGLLAIKIYVIGTKNSLIYHILWNFVYLYRVFETSFSKLNWMTERVFYNLYGSQKAFFASWDFLSHCFNF